MGCGWKGRSQLQKFFSLKIPGYDPWSDFKSSLERGGIFTNDSTFSSNYVVWKFPRDLTPEEWLVPVSLRTVVHREPAESAPVVTDLSPTPVKPLGAATMGWQKIQLDDGSSGYVRTSDLASPAGLTVTLEKLDGKWRLTHVMRELLPVTPDSMKACRVGAFLQRSLQGCA